MARSKARKSSDEGGTPVVETAEGLSCDGIDYVQYIIRDFAVVVTELNMRRSVSNWIERPTEAAFRCHPDDAIIDFAQSSSNVYLIGRGKIDKDSLGVIGYPETTTTDVEVRFYGVSDPQPNGRDVRWRGQVRMSPSDWEINSAGCGYVTVYVPLSEFEALRDSVDRGKFGGATIRMETDLWTEAAIKHGPRPYGITWFLKPGRNRYPDDASAIVGGVFLKTLSDHSRATSEASPPTTTSDVVDRLKVVVQPAASDNTADKMVMLSVQRSLKTIASALVIMVAILAFTAVK